MTSVISRSEETPNVVTDQVLHSQAKHLSSYALNYTIQKFVDRTYSTSTGFHTAYSNSEGNQNFNVLNGSINTIQYKVNTTRDTIEISTDITCNFQGKSISRTGNALIEHILSFISPTGLDNAITTGGTVTIGGSASVIGPIAEHTDLDFQTVFGVTKEEVKAGAHNVYIDPENNFNPVDNVTWVEQVNDNQVLISLSNWRGSGIMIVEGNIKISGGRFSGILWVHGELDMSVGNARIEGAIVIEGSDDTFVLGTADIAYDAALANQSFELLSNSGNFTILSWHD
jgi:hypothetical protein